MRAVVTGAGGMLGQALVPALEAGGWTAVPLAKSDADVTRIDELRRAFERARPDWVFHLAAFTRVNECETRSDFAFQVNAGGAGNAAQAAAEVGAAVLMISTDYVFGGNDPGEGARRPYREDDEPAPLNEYGKSKLKGEVATRVANTRSLIVRTAWLYGKGGRNFPKEILRRARAREPLRVVNDQTGAPTWTEDLAPALVGLARLGQFGVFHCTSSGSCNWHEFAVHLINKKGLNVPVKAIPSTDDPPKRPAYSVLDNDRYERATGNRMPNWKESIDSCLDKGCLGPDQVLEPPRSRRGRET